jgi:hypothetical protein
VQKLLLFKPNYFVSPIVQTGTVIEVDYSYDYYFCSGGTDITSLVTGFLGMQVMLEFQTETTLIHSANLVLPGGVDLVANVGDAYRFALHTETAWKCISGGGHSGGGGEIINNAYGPDWDGVTDKGASQNSLYDILDNVETIIPFLRHMESDRDNVIIGNGTVGQSFDSGSRNIAIGHNTLGNATFGTFNVAIGYEALAADISGHQNTAVGYHSLADTIGDANSAFGCDSLRYNTTGDHNNAFGDGAAYNNTTGDYNNASGYRALYSNITGKGNHAFGYQALFLNTADYNHAFGYNALTLNTTGIDNSAFGYKSLTENTTGNYNSAFGYESLNANTTGIDNSAFGYKSLNANTTGIDNCAFGFEALKSNITGSYNSGFGHNALQLNTATRNTAMGYAALALCTTGDYNTAIGQNALFKLTTGSYNTALGREAGRATSLTTEESTMLGAKTQPEGGSDTNTIAIGYATLGKGSNTVVLGNDDIVDTYLKGIVNVEDTGQIEFPATANPSTNPNTLDDYEEGTWDVTVVCSISGEYSLYDQWETASYIKIGNAVHVHGLIKNAGTSGLLSGILRFSLPFVSQDTGAGDSSATGTAILIDNDIATYNTFASISAGLSYFELSYIDSSQQQINITDTHVLNFELNFGFTYFI